MNVTSMCISCSIGFWIANTRHFQQPVATPGTKSAQQSNKWIFYSLCYSPCWAGVVIQR